VGIAGRLKFRGQRGLVVKCLRVVVSQERAWKRWVNEW